MVEMKSNKEAGPRKIGLAQMAEWFFGVMLVLIGIGALLNPGDFGSGILMFIAAGFLLSPVRALVRNRTNIEVNGGARALIAFVLMVVAVQISEPADVESAKPGSQSSHATKGSDGGEQPKSRYSGPVPSTREEAIQIAKTSSIDFFRDIRRPIKSMSDAQRDRHYASLKGKRIMWIGWVDDARQKLFGGYEVWIDMDRRTDPFSVQNVMFMVSEETALSLKRGSFVFFVGDIGFVTTVLGSAQVRLENMQVLSTF